MAELKTKYMVMPSYWGRDVRHKLVSQGSRTLAVLFPGKNYSAELPLLHVAGRAAAEHGCDVLQLEYGYQSARAELASEDLPKVTEECRRALEPLKETYSRFLFIGKSIGTVVAAETALGFGPDQTPDMLYVTPLQNTVPYIKALGGTVIYGGDDPLFPGKLALNLKNEPGVLVYRIEDANHSLEAGTVNESLAILIYVAGLYHRFIGEVLVRD